MQPLMTRLGVTRASSLRLCLAIVATIGMSVGAAQATPRYAAKYQQSCHLCHHNPTGGGKRSSYAAQYLIPMELSWKPTPEDRLPLLDPQLSPALSVGADVRTLYLYSEDKAYRQNFFQMQGTVYVLFEADPRYSIYLAQGQSQTRELYGMGYILPMTGYAKVGRFTPAFGWKYDNHNAFVRDRLGFAPPAHTDVGFEVGFLPGEHELQLSVTNGAGGLIQDTDHRVAGFARAVTRRRVFGASLALGASFAYMESDLGPTRIGGPFGAFHWGRFTWVGEGDLRRDPGRAADRLVTTQEFTVDLARGIALQVLYDFEDPDTDRKTGSVSQFGVGANGLLYPFLGLQLTVNWVSVDDGPDVEGLEEYVQPRVMVHFLY